MASKNHNDKDNDRKNHILIKMLERRGRLTYGLFAWYIPLYTGPEENLNLEIFQNGKNCESNGGFPLEIKRECHKCVQNNDLDRVRDLHALWCIYKCTVLKEKERMLEAETNFLAHGLTKAIELKFVPIVRFLLAQKTPVQECMFGLAVFTGNVDLVDLLLYAIQDAWPNTTQSLLVNQRYMLHVNSDQWFSLTPLAIAAHTNDICMARFLIQKGAKIHMDDDMALLHALSTKQYAMVGFLLDACVAQHGNYGFRVGCCWNNTALVKMPLILMMNNRACSSDDFEMILNTNTMDIHAHENYALRYAARIEKYEIVFLLIKHGADKNVIQELIKSNLKLKSKCFEKFGNEDIVDVTNCVQVLATILDKDSTLISLENAFAFVVLRDIVLRTMTLPEYLDSKSDGLITT
jgi:ankyrin repeat protein